LANRSPDRRDTLFWKLARAEQTTLAEFGDATRATEYVLCVYDDASASPRVVIESRARVGTSCARVGCWRLAKDAFSYKDSAMLPGGLRSIFLGAGQSGAARVTVKGAGPNLRLPTLPLSPPVEVQLEADGNCWQADFASGGVERNDGLFFRSRGTAPAP
jgi:hypothetical protein